MDTSAQKGLTINVFIEAQLVPFGSFQTRITHQVVEEGAETPELQRLHGEPPYVFPTGTGDIEGPITYSTVAG